MGILGSILGTWFITLILIEMHPIFAIILFTLIMIFKLFSQKKEG